MPNLDPKLTTYDGTAGYAKPWEEPDASLIDSIPGAREAHDAWKAANAHGRDLVEARIAAFRVVRDLKADGAATPEIDAAEATLRAASRAVDANRVPALAAVTELARVIRDAYRSGDTVKRAAAQHAVEAHERAVAAQAELFAALAERDRQWSNAGSPGIAWAARAPHYNSSHLVIAKNATGEALSAFDLLSTQRVIEGEAVEHFDSRLLTPTPEQVAS